MVPDSFTHGTSKQRVRWFQKGLQTGDIAQGDTFAAETVASGRAAIQTGV